MADGWVGGWGRREEGEAGGCSNRLVAPACSRMPQQPAGREPPQHPRSAAPAAARRRRAGAARRRQVRAAAHRPRAAGVDQGRVNRARVAVPAGLLIMLISPAAGRQRVPALLPTADAARARQPTCVPPSIPRPRPPPHSNATPSPSHHNNADFWLDFQPAIAYFDRKRKAAQVGRVMGADRGRPAVLEEPADEQRTPVCHPRAGGGHRQGAHASGRAPLAVAAGARARRRRAPPRPRAEPAQLGHPDVLGRVRLRLRLRVGGRPGGGGARGAAGAARAPAFAGCRCFLPRVRAVLAPGGSLPAVTAEVQAVTAPSPSLCARRPPAALPPRWWRRRSRRWRGAAPRWRTCLGAS